MKIGKKMNKELIRKVFSGEADSNDMKLLAQADAVEQTMRKQWEQEAQQHADEQTGHRIWENVEARCSTKTKRLAPPTLWRWAAACAAVVLIAGSVWLARTTGSIEYEEFIAQQHTSFLLPDSSRVWMQPGSSVRYAKAFNKTRDVKFAGDAVFEVTKRTNSPFRVHIDGAFVEVKGTVFRVQAHNAQNSEVTLLSGLVDLHIKATKKVISMQPSQRIKLTAGSKPSIENIESAIGWQNGNYKFKETRLDVLADIISNLYNTQVVFDKDVSGHDVFNGNLRYDEHPSEVIRRICYIMDLSYRSEQEKIIIYRPK